MFVYLQRCNKKIGFNGSTIVGASRHSSGEAEIESWRLRPRPRRPPGLPRLQRNAVRAREYSFVPDCYGGDCWSAVALSDRDCGWQASSPAARYLSHSLRTVLAAKSRGQGSSERL